MLDEKELRLHYKAFLFSTAICSIVTLILAVIDQVAEEKFSAMESWRDDWLQESGLAPVVLWIDNMLREWLDDLTPGDACRAIVAKIASRSLASAALGKGKDLLLSRGCGREVARFPTLDCAAVIAVERYGILC